MFSPIGYLVIHLLYQIDGLTHTKIYYKKDLHFFLKIYLFLLYMYGCFTWAYVCSTCVPRIWEGQKWVLDPLELELHCKSHAGAGTWTRGLWKSSQFSHSPTHPPSPHISFYFPPPKWELKWKLKGSLESPLCWMELKECFPEVVAHRQICEGTFHWSRHRREDILLKQTHERTHDEGFFVNNTHVIVCHTLLSWVAFVRTPRPKTDLMHLLRQDPCWGKTCRGHRIGLERE